MLLTNNIKFLPSKNNANSLEFSAEFLMARSSDSTLSNDLDFEAAVYVALAYRALRPYRSRGGRCAASVAIVRRTTEVVAVRRRVILDNIIILCFVIVNCSVWWRGGKDDERDG